MFEIIFTLNILFSDFWEKTRLKITHHKHSLLNRSQNVTKFLLVRESLPALFLPGLPTRVVSPFSGGSFANTWAKKHKHTSFNSRIFAAQRTETVFSKGEAHFQGESRTNGDILLHEKEPWARIKARKTSTYRWWVRIMDQRTTGRARPTRMRHWTPARITARRRRYASLGAPLRLAAHPCLRRPPSVPPTARRGGPWMH